MNNWKEQLEKDVEKELAEKYNQCVEILNENNKINDDLRQAITAVNLPIDFDITIVIRKYNIVDETNDAVIKLVNYLIEKH
ncbi:MAG: hypothetical protein EBX50_19525, partial [Chitinophagia bacterium]|nr:hypothetical protein [Chitinophagia bacterium]